METSLSPKFTFPSKCKIQPHIFVDENKDHILNEYGKLNFQNNSKTYLPKGWILNIVKTISHTYHILKSLLKKKI